jgi:hypothetical protein
MVYIKISHWEDLGLINQVPPTSQLQTILFHDISLPSTWNGENLIKMMDREADFTHGIKYSKATIKAGVHVIFTTNRPNGIIWDEAQVVLDHHHKAIKRRIAHIQFLEDVRGKPNAFTPSIPIRRLNDDVILDYLRPAVKDDFDNDDGFISSPSFLNSELENLENSSVLNADDNKTPTASQQPSSSKVGKCRRKLCLGDTPEHQVLVPADRCPTTGSQPNKRKRLRELFNTSSQV